MKIVTVVGARPQFIKASMVSKAITKAKSIREVLVHTGQHFDANMSDIFFHELNLSKPDYSLGIGGGSHGQNTGRMIEGIEQVLMKEKPNWVLVYGDTDSTLAGSLAAVKLHIPVAHVEAGLRSFNRIMPEEINRVLTDHMSTLLLAPTVIAKKNLNNEGISDNKIYIVGDVMLDATIHNLHRAKKPNDFEWLDNESFSLCTFHRAENTDNLEKLLAIIEIINELAVDIPIVVPLHPRSASAMQHLHEIKIHPNVRFINPVGFLEMAWLLKFCSLVLTDSGGIQKEAYFHGKPCVTLRDETEWVELLEIGCNQIIPPTSPNAIKKIKNFQAQIHTFGGNLYGNGFAADKIVDAIISR